MIATTNPTINILCQPTSADWLEQALANIDTILLDHSHCERKAASTAINMMFRYPSNHKLVRQLTAIAQEELEHFEQVNQILERRGIPLAPLNAPPYGKRLMSQVRTQEPYRLLDSLLVSGLIEARSHERLGLLGSHLPDPQLAAFYRGLMASEARHFGIYWLLADTYIIGGASVPEHRSLVQTRLKELAIFESDLLANLHPEPRVHS
ncbi:tRNA isopentenyl-2-thiomethyl-A-37 hydroxylase MiaE [Chamaesiphon sp. VAR_48_metabat_403]|uniref:tRNA-(ms[2]io[6]A)-hydroxylase n=1 Tax=Chamaesiphon sp. VAR_48_metabat_403 TaxID=2964700 RepID=UPI00286D8270|nr:tRNA isopentenyl-2-thiomethyl-A-37 hydroxylase MiaE [Chamaesiphon sp. VAR_48_metabat_403]